jgi:F0F1-type ATP synthase membrane subunit c/vacuolar-type H+-ATPase subunit K
MSAARVALRGAKLLHGVFLLSAILYVWVPTMIRHDASREVPRAVAFTLGLAALSNIGVAIFFRRRMVQPAAERLKRNSEDGGAAKLWRGGVIVSLVFCESIILFGLALRFLGANWSVCGIFYAVGIFLMLAWTPRLELLP